MIYLNGKKYNLYMNEQKYKIKPYNQKYTRLEYIQCDGINTYFDTGLKAHQDIKVEVKAARIQAYGTTDYAVVFGVMQGTSYATSLTINTSLVNSQAISRFGNSTIAKPFIIPADELNDYHIFSISKLGTSTDGVFTEHIYTGPNFTSNGTMLLGGYWLNNSIGTVRGTFNIAQCKIWDNDILVRNFIPVIDENDVSCMYDIVTDSYFYNAGEGNE